MCTDESVVKGPNHETKPVSLALERGHNAPSTWRSLISPPPQRPPRPIEGSVTTPGLRAICQRPAGKTLSNLEISKCDRPRPIREGGRHAQRSYVKRIVELTSDEPAGIFDVSARAEASLWAGWKYRLTSRSPQYGQPPRQLRLSNEVELHGRGLSRE